MFEGARVRVAVVPVALAAVLLPLAAGLGAAAPTERGRTGGIFRVSMYAASGIDYLDPALASTPPAWALLDTTCARLLAYPDKPPPAGFRLQPEVAKAMPSVSRDGKTYTFKLRTGFRFNNRTRVLASAFARAINRALSPKIASPGVEYVRDIVGAGRVLAGKATTASGVIARGNTLVVRLTRPAPDFPHRTASIFFCAVPPSLPVDPEGVGAVPAAGPYYVAEYRRGERVVIRRNRFYGGRRPHHVDGFDVDLRAPSPQDVLKRVDRGEADWGYALSGIHFDPALGLAAKYGINRSRLFLRPGLTLRMLAFNSSRPLFRNNPRLRRAVNFALNRRELTSTSGPNTGRASDQYLPSILPGFRDANVYPLGGDLSQARRLASGSLRGRKAVLYVNSGPLPMALGQLIKQQLTRIGLEVDVRGIPIHSASAAYFKKLAAPGEPWDLAIGLWTPSYIDPFAYINLLLERRFLGATNFVRIVSQTHDRQMRRAARLLQASARYPAYGALDVRIAHELAPLATIDFLNEPTLVSSRVGCIVLRPALDLTAVCLR